MACRLQQTIQILDSKVKVTYTKVDLTACNTKHPFSFFSLHFLIEGVHIWHNDCLQCVHYNESLEIPIWPRSNRLKISQNLSNSSFFCDGVCSYLAQ